LKPLQASARWSPFKPRKPAMPSPQQSTAANNIRTVLLSKRFRYALLVARCQAGKTGSFQELIRLMLLNGDINRAYILCGSSETELRDQAKEDTEKANPVAYARGDIKVLFRQDFKGAEMDVTRALIIVDESHMDQTQKQELDIFLGRYGLSMAGDPRALAEKDTFMLSVDATPYSELSALLHKESHPKHVEQLAPGAGYFGIQDYLYSGLMKATYDISSAEAAFEELVRSRGKKYALMRLTSGKHAEKQEAVATAVYRRLGGKVLYFTAEKTQIEISKLNVAPEVATLIIVRGRLRAGKVVPKQHISFVWEGAKTSKTDALVQGLLGRMCGYPISEGNPYGYGDEKPLIFVPQSALTRREGKVVKASEMERAIMEYPVALPTMGTNLKKAHIASRASNGTTECTPLRLTWDAEDDDWTFTEKYEEKFSGGEDRMAILERCFALLEKNLAAIRDSPNYSAEQKKEILEKIVPAGASQAHVRNMHEMSQLNYFKRVREGYEAGTASGSSGDPNPLSFIVTYRGYKAPHANHRHLYVVFYTTATSDVVPGVMAVDLKSRIPQTNGKSVFSVHDHHVDRPLVAGGVVGFDESKVKTPALLESALHDYLRLYRESGLTVARCIQSNKERFTLSKKAFHYVSKDDNEVKAMCLKLGSEFGVKMKVTYARSGADSFNVKKIEW
jgi:hypothetical protein